MRGRNANGGKRNHGPARPIYIEVQVAAGVRHIEQIFLGKAREIDTLGIYIPIDRRQALARGITLPDRTQGAALMADISGFTPLTEALVRELGPQRGVEELTRQLNLVYEALIAEVDQYGGSVIGFSGDAITCWFDQDDGRRATMCALTMQEAMTWFAEVAIPTGGTVSLAMKVSVVSGPARRFLAGDPQIQTMDLLAGATLDLLAAGEHQAQAGEILLDAATATRLSADLQIREWRGGPGANAGGADAENPPFAVVENLRKPPAPHPWPAIAADALPDSLVRAWLLPPIYERLRSGQGDFLAELRPAVALFLRFTGIDYDTDSAEAQLDGFIRWVQTTLDRYDGVLVQVTIGDKGSYLYGVFGAPVAHDDDAARAVAAALELRMPPPDLAYVREVQIGISAGRMRTGAYGGSSRRTYGILGDDVNLAARLMQHAAPGQILVSERIVAVVERQFDLRPLGEIRVKGKQDALPVSLVAGRRGPSAQRPATHFPHPLVGRDAEIAQITAVLEQARDGHGQVLRVEGGAGVGKSHLAAELVERALGRGMRVALGACQSTTQSTLYTPWRQIFRLLLAVPEEAAAGADRADSNAEQIAAVESWIRHTNPEWLPRLPLLGDVLGVSIPDTASTAGLDPELRQGALFTLVGEIVQTLAHQAPLLLLIEDAHWMDEASLGLSRALARTLARLPVTLALFHRPPLRADWALLPALERLAYAHHLELGELGDEGIAALVADRLAGPLAPLTRDLILERAQGNPFFAEELTTALRETGLLECRSGEWALSEALVASLRGAGGLVWDRANSAWRMAPGTALANVELGLPDSIQGVVLSRLDRLPEPEKLTLKLASVVGRTFNLPVISYAHPLQPTTSVLEAQIRDVETRDFVHRETAQTELLYLFKHNIIQEVAYTTLLYNQRRRLHQAVAEWYEQTYGEGEELADYYPLLVYHWRQAEKPDRECYYAELAGAAAANQFANEEAVNYLSRALELTSKRDSATRYRLLALRETVQDRRGARPAQAEDLAELARLAEELEDGQAQAAVALRQARYAEATGDYPAALVAAGRAVTEALPVSDAVTETAGYILWGRIFGMQGNYEEAYRLLEQSLNLARATGNRNGEAESLRWHGFISLRQGDLPTARDYCEQALAIFHDIGDRAGETASLSNLGYIYNSQGESDAARAYFEQALAIFREVGLRRSEGTNLSNLGMAYQDLGDSEAARATHEQALEICREIVDRQGEAVSLVNLALVYHSLGDNAAARAAGEQAQAIFREVGDRLDEGYALNYLGHALAGLGDLAGADAAYEQALAVRRELGQDAAIMDTLAGQARIARDGGNLARARRLVDTILTWIGEHGVDGIEEPVRVYATCYEILYATANGPDDEAHARAVLTAAHDLLQERAAHIGSEARRLQFLNGVAAHRSIGAAWAAAQPAA
jgi:class 3 adenylate cyclase/tetratricopeptide (TPR) repeat protein